MGKPWRSLSIRVLVSLALLSLPALPASARPTSSEDKPSSPRQPRPSGSWPTWAIQSGAQFRLPPPPDADTTRDEIAVLQELAAQRDPAALDSINYWNTGAPAFRWNNQAVQLFLAKGITVPRAVARPGPPQCRHSRRDSDRMGHQVRVQPSATVQLRRGPGVRHSDADKSGLSFRTCRHRWRRRRRPELSRPRMMPP